MPRFLALAVLACLAAAPLSAQTLQPLDRAETRDARAVSLTVRSLLDLLREAVLRAPEPGLGDRLRPLTQSLVAFEPADGPATDDLTRQLQQLLDEVVRLRDDLRAEGAAVTAGRLDPIVEGLRDALATAREAKPTGTPEQHGSGFRFSWEDDADDNRKDSRENDDAWETERDDTWDARDSDGRYRSNRNRYFYHGARIGEELFWEDALVQDDLPIRYNRVEGFYLGLERSPLDLNSRRPGRIFGEAGYAFGLEDFRYAIGADLRVTPRGPYAVKVGGFYRESTVTEDDWKIDPVENALGAFVARHDAYDYYEAEGWTVYTEGQLGKYGRAQAGFRSEEHRRLDRNVTWSLFGGDEFRYNPAATEETVNSFVGTLELGRVRGLTDLPRGAALRLDAELGQGVGGDADFSRFVADGRLYLPVSMYSSLSLRLRGGTTVGDDVPFQKGFTLGGLGSVRAYPQNAFGGTRMVTSSAEFTITQPGLLDDLLNDVHLFGFADYGWTGNGQAFALADGVGDVGFGVGLDERRVRLELAFPLRDEGFGTRPTLWLRVAPSF